MGPRGFISLLSPQVFAAIVHEKILLAPQILRPSGGSAMYVISVMRLGKQVLTSSADVKTNTTSLTYTYGFVCMFMDI